MNRAEVAVAALAQNQAGAFHRRQATAAGMSADAVKRRLRSGVWRRTFAPGVLALAGWPDDWAHRVRVVSLWAGTGSAVSHASAAVLWGLDGWSEGPLELTVPRAAHHRLARTRVHRRDLDPGEVRHEHGFAVTSPECTLVDVSLQADVGGDRLDDAVESALRLGLTTPDRLWRYVGQRGRGSRVAVLLDGRGGQRPRGSVLEGRFIRAIVAAGLPTPIRQFEVTVFGNRYFIDFAFPELRIAIELDGFEKLRTAASKRNFLRRQNELVAAGWTVLRFSWDDVERRLDWMTSCILEVLAA